MTSKYAIVFPGQGSQSVGMLADIASRYPEVKHTFNQAADILGYDLWQLVQDGPSEKLDQTIYTQPALLTASFAIWQIIQTKFDLDPPSFLAGHSLGEYTALVCANSMDFADALRLVAARARFMQEAISSDVGAMAAIVGLEDSVVKEICLQAIDSSEEILSPANFNSIGQIVIAGHKTAVLRAIILAQQQGAKLARLIPVSVPSHCQLMHPAAAQLAPLLEKIAFREPKIAVINNVNVLTYTTATTIREGLAQQLYMPVRWVEIIQLFAKRGVTQVIECGPGKILTGLNKRIDKNLNYLITSDLESLEALHVT